MMTTVQARGRVFCVLALLFVLAACGTSPLSRKTPESRGEDMSGLPPIAFGMTMEQAHAAIGGGGQWVKAEGGYALQYQNFWSGYTLIAAQYFSPEGNAINAFAYSADAAHADSASECKDFFDTFKTKLDKQYGRADNTPSVTKERMGLKATAVYTFTDSTNIKLRYIYFNDPQESPSRAACLVGLEFNPAWSKLCLFTNNRFCNQMDVYPWGKF